MSYQKHIGIIVPIPVRYYMLEMHLTEEASQDFMSVVLPPCHITEEDTSVLRMSCNPMIIAFETKIVPQVWKYAIID